ALGDGDINAGNAHVEAAIGDVSVLNGRTEWGASAWSAEGDARLDALPALTTLAERIGPSVSFNLTGAPQPRTFTAHAETPFLAVALDGALDEDSELAGPARIVATTSRLSHVARESPFELGAARLEGELRRARGTTAIRATLDAQEIDALGRRTALTGPVEA